MIETKKYPLIRVSDQQTVPNARLKKPEAMLVTIFINLKFNHENAKMKKYQ
jgi:hypothetical protein